MPISTSPERAVDAALNDLVESHWRWIQAGRSAGDGRALAARAAGLAGELPEDHRSFARSLAEGIEEAVEHPPPPRPKIGAPEVGAFPVPAATASRAETSAVDRDKLDGLIEKLGPPPPSPLPTRNRGRGGPHVELFSEQGGLIHGGVVRGPSRTLVCRAFRLFRATRSPDRLPSTAKTVVVVAGVAEVQDADGRVLERWSTAERLKSWYADASQPLPGYATRSTRSETFGHYFATRNLVDRAEAGGGAGGVESPDDGWPFPLFALGMNPPLWLGPASPFKRSPGPEAAVEHAHYDDEPATTPGFVIATPYLLVFAPDPRLPKAVVALTGVYREARFTRRKGKGDWGHMFPHWGLVEHERRARWVTRSVDLG